MSAPNLASMACTAVNAGAGFGTHSRASRRWQAAPIARHLWPDTLAMSRIRPYYGRGIIPSAAGFGTEPPDSLIPEIVRRRCEVVQPLLSHRVCFARWPGRL